MAATTPGGQQFNGASGVVSFPQIGNPGWTSSIFTVPDTGAYAVNGVFTVQNGKDSPLTLQSCTTTPCNDTDWQNVSSVHGVHGAGTGQSDIISVNAVLLLKKGDLLRFYVNISNQANYTIQSGSVLIFTVITTATNLSG